MPDAKRRSLAPAKPNAVVASAQVLNTTKLRHVPKPEEWADESWGYYDTTPEVRFACGWLANAMSRCRLTAALPGDSGDEPVRVEDGPAFDLIEQFAGGMQGQSAILSDATTHLTVPGIGYLVGEPTGPEVGLDPDTGEIIEAPETWQVVSSDELSLVEVPGGKRYAIKTGEGRDDLRILAADAVAVKLWRAHKRWSWKPDSPIRAALPVLRELELLTQHVDASLVSRLAGAGILILPNSIEFPISERNADAADPFVAELMDAMITPIGDRDAASAVVPFVIRVPDEAIEAIKHITFSTPLDEKVQALRDEALRRFAAGMDLPAEVIMGLGDSNHWTAWQIEESALKLHVEPMLESICHGLTVGYLQPALRALGVANWRQHLVWYDTSELTVRPDRSGDAKDLYDRQAINVEALRRETGFGEEDAPELEVLRDAILLDLIKGAPTLAPALLPYVKGFEDIRIETEGTMPSVAPGQDPGSGEPEPVDGPDSGGDRALPDTQDAPPPPPGYNAAEAALLAACDGIVHRALERAGTRLATEARKAGITWHVNGTEFARLHTFAPEGLAVDPSALVRDAWSRVSEIAVRHGVDCEALEATLHDYTARLIETGAPHDYDRLAEAIGAHT